MIVGSCSVLLVLLVVSTWGCVDHPASSLPLERVVDGDTLVIRVPGLPSPLGDRLYLRIMGVDTPEVRGSRCDAEFKLGRTATDFVVQATSGGIQAVRLCQWDKFGGRVLGDVILSRGRGLLSEMLIHEGHAKPYLGKGARYDWCAASSDVCLP